MGEFPSLWSYGRWGNGRNCMAMRDSAGNEFYFSYQTMVAFRSAISREIICIKNYWRTTTGKHLNMIEPRKDKRVDRETFDKLYALCFPAGKDAKVTL